jgi:hypothetical protein
MRPEGGGGAASLSRIGTSSHEKRLFMFRLLDMIAVPDDPQIRDFQ